MLHIEHLCHAFILHFKLWNKNISPRKAKRPIHSLFTRIILKEEQIRVSEDNILITNNKQKFSLEIFEFFKPIIEILEKCLKILSNVPVNKTLLLNKYLIHQLRIDIQVEKREKSIKE